MNCSVDRQKVRDIVNYFVRYSAYSIQNSGINIYNIVQAKPDIFQSGGRWLYFIKHNG